MKSLFIAVFAAVNTAAVAQAQLPTLPKVENWPINPDALKIVRQPDLVVQSILPRMLGGRPSLNICVRNAGTNSSAAFETQAISQAIAPPGQSPITYASTLGSHRFAGLAGGATTCADISMSGIRLPTCVKYTVIVDSRSEVRESSESNNTREHLSECYGGPIPPR